MTGPPRKVRAPDLTPMKARGERIVMLTAYDATMARLLDRAGIDVLLVGDSLGQVILGLDTTIPVTLDAVIHHARRDARRQPRSRRGGHAVSDLSGFGGGGLAERGEALP